MRRTGPRPRNDAVHVARAAREVVGVIERLHAHHVAVPAERAGERLREMPVAPAGRDLLRRRRDRERDAQPPAGSGGPGAHQLGPALPT